MKYLGLLISAIFYVLFVAFYPVQGVKRQQGCPDISVAMSTSSNFCVGDTATFMSSLSGGTSPYVYNWVGGYDAQHHYQSSNSYFNAPMPVACTNYTVGLSVQDSKGCMGYSSGYSFKVDTCK